ncbi:Exosome complex component MTR3 [Balamuthia mandrillaris]
MASAEGKKDKFRFVAPVETRIPIVEGAVKHKPETLIKKNIRTDGRTPDQFRPIFLKTGVITQASGSAYIELNNTKVIVGVYGPRQTPKTTYSEQGKLNCDFKYTTFAFEGEKRKYMPDKEEKEFSMLMQQALEVSLILDTFPKAEVDVFALVLQADGSALSAAITAASLALADAGIEMYDLVPACSIASVGSVIVLDPSGVEEKHQRSSLTLAYMPSQEQVTQMLQKGELSTSQTLEALELCIDGCTKIYSMMKQNLVESTSSKLVQENNNSS